MSGAQLIDPTLVLSLAPALAVFFSPGVIPSWSETDGLENELFPHVRFSEFGEDGMGHPGYRSAYEAAWQRLRAAVAGVFFNSVRRSVCKADKGKAFPAARARQVLVDRLGIISEQAPPYCPSA